MTDTGDLESLRQRLQYVEDRWAVLDCVMTQSRGHDRHDTELMASVYAEDGIDEHGGVVKPGAEYGEYANLAHSSVFEDHLHNITTHTCDIDGDEAHCESYVIGAMRTKGGKVTALMGGRYLDRLQRRDGAWKIVLRRCTVEWMTSVDSSVLSTGAVAGFIKGRWDKSDPSYARPLRLDGDPVDRW